MTRRMANGQPNPSGTGRYCPPRICWCGDCAWHVPLPALVAPAARAGDDRQARTWDEREDATWLDTL